MIVFRPAAMLKNCRVRLRPGLGSAGRHAWKRGNGLLDPDIGEVASDVDTAWARGSARFGSKVEEEDCWETGC